MLNPWRLRLLAQLSALGTMRAVAAAEQLSVSTVSQQLATLEREAQVALLERAGRSVRLTPAGRRLVAEATPVLDALAGLEASVRGERTEVRGTIRLATFSSALAALVLPVVVELRDLHPRLRIQVEEREPDESVPLLQAGHVDVLLAATFGDPHALDAPGRIVRPLARDRLAAVVPASHPAAAFAAVGLRDLVADPWALEPENTYLAAHIRTLCEAAGVNPDVTARLSGHASMQQAVAAGAAITILPEMALTPHAPGIAVRPLDPPSSRTVVALCSAAQAQRAGVVALLDALSRRGEAWRGD